MQFIGREPAQALNEIEKFIQQVNDGIDKNESYSLGNCIKGRSATELSETICFWNYANA
jgi:hypothetical protein